MNTTRLLALLLATAALAGCSRRYLEPPPEYPYVAPVPMREWRTDLADARAYYYVDQPIAKPAPAEAPAAAEPPATEEDPAASEGTRGTLSPRRDPAAGMTF